MDLAKQCYHCQGLGHVQADCPTLRLSGGAAGGRCYSCGQMGHLAVSLDSLHQRQARADCRTAQLPKPEYEPHTSPSPSRPWRWRTGKRWVRRRWRWFSWRLCWQHEQPRGDMLQVRWTESLRA